MRSSNYLICLIISVFLLLNISVGLSIGLTDDGAHYALYGEHLAWSYFDHPPLVGWLQASALLFGHTDFLMRVWPCLILLATVMSLYYIAPRMLTIQSSYFKLSCVGLFIAQSY